MQEVENCVSPATVRPTRPAAHITAFIGVAAVMLVAFVALSRQATPVLPVQEFTSTVPQQPDPLVVVPAVAVADSPPLRFTNPFDKTEVFEFPAGTSRTAAREAVAEILRQRATERLAQDAGAKRRR